MRKEMDITELIFPVEELSSEEKKIEERKWTLWDSAQIEAGVVLHDLPLFSGPVRFYDYMKTIYKFYLNRETLPYDLERGF